MTSCISEWLEKGKSGNQFFSHNLGYIDKNNKYTSSGKMNIISNVILLALFIINVIAVTRGMSATALGGSTVALGYGVLGTQLGLGKIAERKKADLVITGFLATILITLGALACGGVITGVQLGCLSIGIISAHAIFWGCFLRGAVYAYPI
jgi:hypothetical protein